MILNKTQLLDKITKLLMLSTSPIEGEALSATRKANEILSKNGHNWQTFFKVLTPTVVYQQVRVPTENDKIEEAFEIMNDRRECSNDSKNSFWDFIDSLEKQWRSRGKLSEKQKAALFKCAYK